MRVEKQSEVRWRAGPEKKLKDPLDGKKERM
jgi:hypothetical protein